MSICIKTLLYLCLLFFSNPTLAITLDDYLDGAPLVVPKGNIGQSVKKSTDLAKYRDILNQLTQENYGCVVRHAAELYKVDPVAILGSIIGEHTYNVDNWDVWGERYLYMRKRWISRFSENGLDLRSLLEEPVYKSCEQLTDNNYELWTCYNSFWKKDRRNTRRNNKFWEIKWTFFNPLGSGYTYGLGQLGPERALMVTDLVSRVSGFETLNLNDPVKIYDHILNPQVSIHYVAASNRVAIDIYMDRANFDISQNMGVIATLYNLGREAERAERKFEGTKKRLSEGQDIDFPKSNYYGWFINEKEDEIRSTYQQKILSLPRSTCDQYIL